MKLIRVAAAVLNQTPMDWRSNRDNIRAAIDAAREEAVGVLCLPEMCIPGYGCEDAYHSPGLWRTSWEILEELLPDTRGLVASFGLPIYFQNGLYNAACLAADGRVLGFTAKRFLAGEGLYYEPRWFDPWPAGVRAEVELGGRSYPLGDLHYDVGGVKIGFEICEDAWVANRPGARLAARGVDVILNPSASHFAFDKIDVRRRFVLEGSRAFGVSYVYSNLLGNASGRAIFDGGAMIAASGRLAAEGPRFSYEETQLTSAVIDVELARMNQVRVHSFKPDVSTADDCVHDDFAIPTVEHTAPVPPTDRTPLDCGDKHAADWEAGPRRKEEEFTRAISLALFDYLRKSRSRGFVISLSGGADSSAAACLVALMVDLCIRELGTEGFRERLGYIDALADVDSPRDATNRLLTTVYQSTRNSGDVTRSAARQVAEAVGAEHLAIDVDALVEKYVATISDAIGRPLSWETDDLALQNIQARSRAPGVWMLANIRGALLLSTSNRSEAAVGYATMDGDTAGGLSPIAGIDKAFLRTWLSWLETTGPTGLYPIPALSAVTVQQPTAELRPQEDHQTDEADLMPYPLLDAVERAAIRDKRTPLEVYQLMRTQFAEYEPPQLAVWVERFFTLWSRNQWKRERYAPSFHVDDENLDPKTWCRFPILSGGFEWELDELRNAAEK